jgi:cytochrome c-type biogenesis protein
MSAIEPLLQNISGLSPLALALVALAGMIVGIAPSSLPLLSVAAGLAAGQGARDIGDRRIEGLWLSVGFALGIATVDAVIGAFFGLAGFAVLRALASFLALAYALLAAILVVIALALLRIIHMPIPVFLPSSKSPRDFLGSYLLGLPFGLSTCPACTPLILPVVAAAGATADPLMGAVLMFAFGVSRGIPIVVVGTAAGTLAHRPHTYRFALWAERVGAAFTLAAALYFLYQALVYSGWLSA